MSQHGSVASSVELVSNAVFVSGLNIRHSGNILQPGRYPISALPSLLHETTHWDTFVTPVGEALAHTFASGWRSLQIHKARTSEGTSTAESSAEYEALLSYARYNIATEILRPLAEGMALFAEFDMIPGDSPVTTPMTRLVGAHFREWVEGPAEKLTLGQITRVNLDWLRGTDAHVARKETLLSQPFHTIRGGYLPGYFLVKNLRNYLLFKKQLVKLLDGDLFLYCVKAAVFGDLELSRLLVDPTLDFYPVPEVERQANPRDVINQILKRFQMQLEFLFHDMDEAFLLRLEKVVGSGEPWTWLDLQVNTTPERQEDNIHVLNEALSPRAETAALSEHIDASIRLLLANRRLLCLASFDGHVCVNEHGRCLVYSEPSMAIETVAFAGPALPNAAEETGEGTLEIYLEESIAAASALICVVHLKGQCVACFEIGSRQAFNPSEFSKNKPSFRWAAEFQQIMMGDLKKIANNDVLVTHYVAQIEEVTEGIYGSYNRRIYVNLWHGDYDALMKAGSLIDLVDDADLDMLSLAARLSLKGGGMFLEHELAESLEKSGLTLAAFEAKMTRIQEAHGLPLISRAGAIRYFNF